MLGIYVSLARDTIQIVRTFGNVLRFALALSLAVEILSGLLIDTPIHFLGVTGRIGELGPITGLVNTTDQLGLVAVVALITFATEMRTRSVQRGLAVGSLILGTVCLLLSRAPLAIGAAIVVAAAAAVLYGLRRASDSSRRSCEMHSSTSDIASRIVQIFALVGRGRLAVLFAPADLREVPRCAGWRRCRSPSVVFPLRAKLGNQILLPHRLTGVQPHAQVAGP